MTDDMTLMSQVQAGQLDKLGVLFERHKVSLFNYFLRCGNARAASEDLVQETFMKILAYRSSFNGTASFKSWMYGIARNTMADYYRKRKSSDQHLDINELDVATEGTLGEQMQSTQQHAFFDRALASLPLELREILVLSRFHQLNYEEIAQLIDCNLNTLKSRMRKAISLLGQAYQSISGERI